MARVLLNLKWEGEPPTLDAVAERYGIDPADLDSEFGVIEIDPDEHLYTISIERSAAERVSKEFEGSDEVEGPFGDVRIEPFDLQE